MAAPIHIASSRQAASLTAAQRDNLSSTPGGNNLFGTTPGGTRIMYSRDQLLSLASSPLSQTATFGKQSSIPAEISRSPEKSNYSYSQSLGKSPRTGASNLSMSASRNQSSISALQQSSSPTIVSNGFSKIGRERSGSNGNGNGLARSPGGAFNFNGPISPTKMSALSAQLKGSSVGGNATSANSIQVDQQPPSDTGGTAKVTGKEEQFDMEL